MGLFKRKDTRPILTSEAYARWLRAQRPDLDTFLRLSDVEQEHLAGMGDEYVQDVCLGIGYAVRNPEAAENGRDALQGDVGAEGTLAQQLAVATAAKLLERSHTRPKAPLDKSMGGNTERRQAAVQARQRGKDEGRSLFGRRPD